MPAATASTADPRVSLRAEGLTKIYRAGELEVPALRGVDIALYEGEIVVLLGQSGSGKSTLLNILGGLDVPTSGRVFFDDVEITATTESELTRYRRDHVGFVFQFYNLVPSLTARENVALVTEIARDPMDPADALGVVGMSDRLDHFPRATLRRRAATRRDRARNFQATRHPAVRRTHGCARQRHGDPRAGGARNRQFGARNDRCADHAQHGDRGHGASGHSSRRRTDRRCSLECGETPSTGLELVMPAVSALNRKLLRDLWRLRGQVLAVSLVVSAGVGVLVMSLTALTALSETARAYYERYRFAHVFAQVERAPERIARRIAELPGVQTVETRISRLATIDIDGFDEPVVGRFISIPEHGEPLLNRLALREGRFVAAGHVDEIILTEPFAVAHDLRTGDTLQAVMNGHKRTLEIVGIALSPEFVYAIAPGSLMPDDHRFGIGWMGRQALESAYDLDGAFNDVSLTLMRGVDPESITERLDQILKRYGGVRAYSRDDQISNWFLMNELDQLRAISTILPTIFLAVAVFLTNTLLSRIIATERGEIGLMKAFGYSNAEVGWHYAALVIAMTSIGIVARFCRWRVDGPGQHGHLLGDLPLSVSLLPPRRESLRAPLHY